MKSTSIAFGIVATGLGLFVGTSAGFVTVAPLTGVTKQLVGGKWEITISADPAGSIAYTIQGDANDDIRFIHIDHTGAQTSDIFNLHISGISDIDNIARTAGVGQVWITNSVINGNFGSGTSTSGRIQAWNITNVVVGGDVRGTIRMETQAGTTAINVNNFVVDGDFLQDFLNPNGGGTDVTIGGRIIGVSAANPTDFTALLGWQSIECAGMEAAAIDGRIISPMDIGTLLVHGDIIDTSLRFNSLESIVLEGSASNSMIESDTALTSTPNPVPIIVGGSLDSTSSITVPTSGLAGQIIVNSANGAGSWDGDINVGAVTLAPGYTQTHTSLGGGAAGVVPFDLHGTDSSPLDSESVAYTSRPSPSSPIEIRHYGPIAITGDGLSAVTLEADSGNGSSIQTDCLTSVSVGSDGTVLLLTPEKALLNGYTYRVTTVRDDASNRVECDLGLSPNPLVADYTYEFCVGTALPSDINGDDSVDVFDFAMLAENFSTLGCLLPGDLNADGSVDVFDFAIFAGDFSLTGFGSCSTGAAATRMGAPAGGMESLVKSLGYESVAEYCDWLKALPKKDQITEIAALLELAQEQK